MKYLIFILLTALLVSCGEKKIESKPEKQSESKAKPHLSQDEIDLKYSTYVVVKERHTRFEGDKKFVKMDTEIVNRTDKDIHCIKAWIVIRDDLTGQDYCKFYVDCPKDIPANGRIEFKTHEYECDPNDPMHKMLTNLEMEEFNAWVAWDVHQIKFEGGRTIVSDKINEGDK